jgi:hypothetical protein
MRPFCLSLCLLTMLCLPAGVHASAPSTARAMSSACNVTPASPAAANEPPAWLLLASAVVLLAAGRLAGRP